MINHHIADADEHRKESVQNGWCKQPMPNSCWVAPPSCPLGVPSGLHSCLSPLNSFSSLYLWIPSSSLSFSPPAFFTSVLFLFATSCLTAIAGWIVVDGGVQRQFWSPGVHRRQHGQTLARLKPPSLITSLRTEAMMQKVAFNDSSIKPLECFYMKAHIGLSEVCGLWTVPFAWDHTWRQTASSPLAQSPASTV